MNLDRSRTHPLLKIYKIPNQSQVGCNTFLITNCERGEIRPAGQTPQLAEAPWLIAMELSTRKKRFRTKFR